MFGDVIILVSFVVDSKCFLLKKYLYKIYIYGMLMCLVFIFF